MNNSNNIYPTEVSISQDIADGCALSRKNKCNLINSFNAISVKVQINNPDYLVDDVQNALKKVFDSILKYY